MFALKAVVDVEWENDLRVLQQKGMFVKVGAGCSNTERVSTAWLCTSLFLGLEAETAFNMSWLLKNNYLQRKPKPETQIRTTGRPWQKWEPYPPQCYLCKQVFPTESPACQIQLSICLSPSTAASPGAGLGMMLQL